MERWFCHVCADFATGGHGLLKLSESMARTRRTNGVCPYCGATEAGAKETGLVGCPLCYVAFDAAFWRELGVPKAHWTRADAW